MKYENPKQIRELIYKSNVVYIYVDKNIVQFIGNELEKCEIKLPSELINEIATVCHILEIDCKIY